MNCQEFLARHSEYLDGELDAPEVSLFEAHIANCPSCSRYDRVVRGGLQLVRQLPEIEPSSDFFPRLQHRIYHVEEASRAASRPSSVGAILSLAVAGALAVLAWGPFLRLEFGGAGADGPVAGTLTEAAGEGHGSGTATSTPSTAPVPSIAPIGQGGSVHLAAEAEGLPRIDPNSVVWPAEGAFGLRARYVPGAWWPGMTTSAPGVSVFRPMRTVDFQTAVPYSPLVDEAPLYRRPMLLMRPDTGWLGRE